MSGLFGGLLVGCAACVVGYKGGWLVGLVTATRWP